VDEQTIKLYFPNEPESVDRAFAWAVYETLMPESAERHFQTTLDDKHGGRKAEEAPQIQLSRTWLKQLLLHAPKGMSRARRPAYPFHFS
jgi:hypothetical protein